MSGVFSCPSFQSLFLSKNRKRTQESRSPFLSQNPGIWDTNLDPVPFQEQRGNPGIWVPGTQAFRLLAACFPGPYSFLRAERELRCPGSQLPILLDPISFQGQRENLGVWILGVWASICLFS